MAWRVRCTSLISVGNILASYMNHLSLLWKKLQLYVVSGLLLLYLICFHWPSRIAPFLFLFIQFYFFSFFHFIGLSCDRVKWNFSRVQKMYFSVFQAFFLYPCNFSHSFRRLLQIRSITININRWIRENIWIFHFSLCEKPREIFTSWKTENFQCFLQLFSI